MIYNKITLLILTVALVGAYHSTAAPNPKETSSGPKSVDNSFDISSDDLANNVNDNNIIILPYDPIEPKTTDFKTSVSRGSNNKLKSSSFTSELERETSAKKREPNVAGVMAAGGEDALRSGSPNVDKIKDIAMNSREVRLMGPNQKEVEMKDDLSSKVVVALDNLSKEAQIVLSQVNDKLDKGWTELKSSEVWGQVNDKLDKGWTDFKSMVEGVVAPSKSG